ncbi:MAG: c-type cytochrome [Acidiferrobacterales bacterium]
MNRFLLLILGGCFLGIAPYSQAMGDVEKGREFFNDVQGGNCRNCHSTKGTKLVGPGLRDVMVRHSEEWIRTFVTDPQQSWEMDHPETVELKQRVRGTKRKYPICQKGTMTEETKDNLIEFLESLTVKE